MDSQPSFYLDANIARDILTKRNKNTVQRFERICKNGCRCYMSPFGIAEMADNEQEHRFIENMLARNQDPERFCRERYQRGLGPSDLLQVRGTVNDFIKWNGCITVLEPKNSIWGLLAQIKFTSNVFAPDALHLAAAWDCGADILLTNDEQFKREGNRMLEAEAKADLVLCSADELPGVLERMGVHLD